MEKERTAQLERVIRQEHPNVAGIVVRKDGEAVYEKYFNGCTGASRVHVFSVTKSVVSALVGIAISPAERQSPHAAAFVPWGSAAHPFTLVALLNAICSSLLPKTIFSSTEIPSGRKRFSLAKLSIGCPVALLKMPDRISGPIRGA